MEIYKKQACRVGLEVDLYASKDLEVQARKCYTVRLSLKGWYHHCLIFMTPSV